MDFLIPKQKIVYGERIANLILDMHVMELTPTGKYVSNDFIFILEILIFIGMIEVQVYIHALKIIVVRLHLILRNPMLLQLIFHP